MLTKTIMSMAIYERVKPVRRVGIREGKRGKQRRQSQNVIPCSALVQDELSGPMCL